MRHLAFVALAFATCLPASRAAAAAESKMPSLELTAHHGEMYAARTYIDVDVEGTYFAESGRLDPGIHIGLEFKGPCSEWGCNSRSVSHTYKDIAPLVETLRGAQPHFVDGTPYTHAFKSDPRSRDFMEGTATIDATTKRLRVLFDKDVEVTFDADEVAYFLGMLDSAQAQLMQIRPQIDAFNAARAFLQPPPPAIRRDSRMSDSRLKDVPGDVLVLAEKMATCARYADAVDTLPEKRDEALAAMDRAGCKTLTVDIAAARVRYPGNRSVEYALGVAARR